MLGELINAPSLFRKVIDELLPGLPFDKEYTNNLVTFS